MAHPHFHVPVNLIRRNIIDYARLINRQNDEGESPDNDLSLVVVDNNGVELGTINCTIDIVSNSLTRDVFGANVTIRRHYFDVAAGEGMVDYDLILPQVDENIRLGPALIRIRAIDLISGNNANDFIDQVQQQILNEW